MWELWETIEYWCDPTNMFCIAGVMLFAAWLLQTSLGRQSLVGIPIRRNRLGIHIPLIAFLVWMGPPYWIGRVIQTMIQDRPPWQQALMDNVIMTFSWIFVIIIYLILAKMNFARGLRGFGLHYKGIMRDFGASCVNLLSIWPLVIAMIIVVTKVGQWTKGSDYQIEQHIALEHLVKHDQWPLQISIIVLAVVIAPLVEELLFRGLIQSLFRSVLQRPWASIFLVSIFFVTVHANTEHWPSLFILSMGIGYAYEKSGSLWRPIFIHALFNGTTVLSYFVTI